MLGRLTKGQASVYNEVKGLVARGLGTSDIRRTLTEVGRGIRYEQVGQLVNYFKGTTQAGYEVAHVRRDYFPDVSKFRVAITTLRREYSYTVRLGRDGGVDELGRPTYQYVTVTSDLNMTIQDILDEADSYLEESEEGYALLDYDPTVVEALRAGPGGTLLKEV